MVDINKELFRRTSSKTKIDVVMNLTTDELFKCSKDTLIKIIKKVGKGSSLKQRSHNKDLYIRRDLRAGNNWNSIVEEIDYYNKKLIVIVYLQYENTDTSDSFDVSMLLSDRESRFDFKRSDRYGNPRTYYATYTREDKAKVIRSILLEYIKRLENE